MQNVIMAEFHYGMSKKLIKPNFFK